MSNALMYVSMVDLACSITFKAITRIVRHTRYLADTGLINVSIWVFFSWLSINSTIAIAIQPVTKLVFLCVKSMDDVYKCCESMSVCLWVVFVVYSSDRYYHLCLIAQGSFLPVDPHSSSTFFSFTIICIHFRVNNIEHLQSITFN